jgi:hypothetical protein
MHYVPYRRQYHLALLLTFFKINTNFQILVQRGNDGDYPKILFQVSVINKVFYN